MFLKVEDSPGFVRDQSNRAILNVDNNALLAYKKQKAARSKTEQQIVALSNDVSSLKNEMSEIKEMLSKLLDK